MIILKCYYHIMAIIKKIFYKIIYGKKIKFGRNVTFRKGFSLVIEKNGKVSIGDNCFFNNYCTICARDNIRIGNNCLFGENIKIYDNNHIFKNINELIENQGYKTGAIKIGNNCWIANNVMIMKNTNVGNNCVISVNEILSTDVLDNSVFKDKIITTIVDGRKND